MATFQRNAFKVKMFHNVIRLSNALNSFIHKLVPAPFRVMQIGSAFWQSRALYAATELGVADAIGDNIMSINEVAEKVRLHPDHLYRLLRMLASIGVFEECKTQVFRNNKLSDCLRSHSAQSVRQMVLMHNSPEMSRPWFESLSKSMRNGDVPFAMSHGKELFEYLDNHPEFDALFTGAMESVEALTGTDHLNDFNWECFERIIDVGGSNGSKTLAILKRNPGLHALVFDRPQVIRDAAEGWRGKVDNELLSRLTFMGGDMLEAIPSANSDRDLYLFIAIFHCMDDVQAERILTNLRRACAQHHPTIAIIDCVADSPRIDPAVASFDMQMLMGTRGRERTETEWRDLLERCGFVIQEIVSLRTFARLLVITIGQDRIFRMQDHTRKIVS